MAYIDLTEQFAIDLAYLADGDAITIRSGARYVQILQDTEFLRTEVVSNDTLHGPERLTPDEEHLLRAAGWQKPDPPWKSFWHQQTPWPLTAATATTTAKMILSAMDTILGSNIQPLTVHARNLDTRELLQIRALRALVANHDS